ncbi:MAG: glycine betaine ABC transporter substrate-binding protein [Planctomycetota bacterium]
MSVRRWLAASAVVVVVAVALTLVFVGAAPDRPLRVGSKTFTEQVVLGEVLEQLASSAGTNAEHRRDLGDSRILFNALLAGDLDAYPEYTGTLFAELLRDEDLPGFAELREHLGGLGLGISEPIGFNNTYAIAMRRERAAELGVARVSDLADHPGLRMGFTPGFMERADGWPGLRAAYGLAGLDARGMNHDLAYRALESGDIDAVDAYSTDAEIAYYDLVWLEDDRRFFPRYDAVVLYRLDLAERAPEALAAMLRLEGALDALAMSALNESAKIGRVPEAVVAQRFIAEAFGVETQAVVETRAQRLVRTTLEQLRLVGVSMLAAVLVSIPLGIVAARVRPAAPLVLGAVGILQTIPALALLVLLIRPFGLTSTTAIVALFLYSLLPIVRNTHAALTSIPGDLRESADAIGLTAAQRLRWIEMPLATRSILAGIKTAIVINIGTATLAALIGAGGYGQPILTGIRLDDFGLILEGAVPAAAMAIVFGLTFDGIERAITPRGLRAA